MRVGITINNILRDHIIQLCKIYYSVTGELPIEPINPYNLEASFPTKIGETKTTDFKPDEEITFEYHEDDDKDFDVYKFLHQDASFEIFGRAEEVVSGMLIKLKQIGKRQNTKFILLNKESSRSKCATLFFLSKNNFDFDEIHFPKTNKDFWTNVDVLITDDPKILNAKPAKKTAIKFQTEFNIDIKTKYSIIKLNEIEQLLRKIKKIKARHGKNRGKNN